MPLELLTYSNLNRFAGEIAHFSSTRKGGISTGEYASLNLGNFSDDKREHILQNRHLLCKTLGIPYSHLVGAHQVHGTEVKLVDAGLVEMNRESRNNVLEGFDALICNTPGICIAVTTADCVPILLFDTVTKTIAVIHSGWRSTLNNIVNFTLSSMKEHFSVSPASVVAAIGPCISGKVYEVGTELETQFRQKGFDTDAYFQKTGNGKYLFDIRLAVESQLQMAGIQNIEVSPHCTFSEPERFFSARRQGIMSGRMLSGIMLLN